MTNEDFQPNFQEALMEDFNCDQQTALKIAQKANLYQEERDIERTPSEWIEKMEKQQHLSVKGRWNWAVTFFDADSFSIGNNPSKVDFERYKL